MGTVVVQRSFRVIHGENSEEVDLSCQIEQPFFSKTDHGEEWQCLCSMSGCVSDDWIVFGEDSLQSLLNGIQSLKEKLERLPFKVFWLSNQVGDLGIPKFVSISLGHNFSVYCEGLLLKAESLHVELLKTMRQELP
jgi:hypothetical protein